MTEARTRVLTRPAVERAVRPALLVGMILPFAAPASAIDWQLAKGVGASATYRDADTRIDEDDAAASPNGERPGDRTTERSGESVLSVSPFVRLEGRGHRSEVSLAGRFELRRFVEEERDEFAPQIALSSRTTLVERFAEFGFSARVSQRSVSAEPLVGESLTRFDDTEQVYEIGFGPTIGDRIGDRARYRASYGFAASRGSDEDLAGSDTHSVSARVLGLVSEKLVLIGGGDHDLARFESGERTTAGLVSIGAGYRFRPTLVGLVVTGYDRVDAGEIVTAEEGGGTLDDDGITEGSFWSVEGRWQPNARIDVQVGYGERAYGRKPSASVTLNGRRSTIELAWSRSLAFAADGDRDDLLLLFEPGDGASDGSNGVPSPGTVGGGGIGLGEDSADPGDGVGEALDGGSPLAPLGRDAGSVDEVVDLTYSLRGRRSTLSASVGWARRERLETELVSDGLEYGLGFRRTLSRRVEASAGWTAIESDSDERGRTRENRFRVVVSVAL